jgi:hypothetical protein
VVGGQWSAGGAAGGFFRGQISKNARFLGCCRSVSDRLLAGFFLILGKLGVKGKGFCSMELEISTICFVLGMFRIG